MSAHQPLGIKIPTDESKVLIHNISKCTVMKGAFKDQEDYLLRTQIAAQIQMKMLNEICLQQMTHLFSKRGKQVPSKQLNEKVMVKNMIALFKSKFLLQGDNDLDKANDILNPINKFLNVWQIRKKMKSLKRSKI